MSTPSPGFWGTAAALGTRILAGGLLLWPGTLSAPQPKLNPYRTQPTLPDKLKDEGDITLYRGVYVGHPDYENAKKGMAVPRGGDAGPTEHNDGNNESIYTSWSIYPSVADKFGGRKGPGGVVLKKTFDVKQVVPSPDKFQQGEVLVPGVVKGATVTPATPNPKKMK